MKAKTCVLSLISLLCCSIVQAQPTYTQFFVTGKHDTIYCTLLSFGMYTDGTLYELEYTDAEGKTTKLKGKNKMPDIISFYYDSVYTDYAPLLSPFVTDQLMRKEGFTTRVVDGKIKVYYSGDDYHYRSGSFGDGTGHVVSDGNLRFFVQMPDGAYYRINNSNLKKYIEPYIFQCAPFKSQYTGPVNDHYKDFMQMIWYYNSLCE